VNTYLWTFYYQLHQYQVVCIYSKYTLAHSFKTFLLRSSTWIYCHRCSSFRPHARGLPTVEPVRSLKLAVLVVVVIEVVERLSHWALEKVAVHVVRRGESYCTVFMPFSLLNLPHTNTTLNRAEHALAADTPRTQLEVRRHMDPRSSASRGSNTLLYGSLVRWSQNKRKAERLLNKRRGNLGVL
jgi:hypothetical protein